MKQTLSDLILEKAELEKEIEEAINEFSNKFKIDIYEIDLTRYDIMSDDKYRFNMKIVI